MSIDDHPAPTAVLVHDQDGALWAKAQLAAAQAEVPLHLVRAADHAELGRSLTDRAFAVLVAGPGLDGAAGVARLEIIREELPRLVTIMVTDRTDPSDAAPLVRAGAIDLLTPTVGLEHLAASLGRAVLLARRIADPAAAPTAPAAPAAPPTPLGRVLSVTSASGGSGTTFLATNLAGLRRGTVARTCVVDLDTVHGGVAAALQLQPRFTAGDLVGQGGSTADLDDHLEELCEPHPSGAWVLASPASAEGSTPLGPADVVPILEAAARRFDLVIVDVATPGTDLAAQALLRSDEVVAVATLDVPSLRALGALLEDLRRIGVSDADVHAVINKAEPDSGIDPVEVAELLGRSFAAVLPYDRAAPRSLNAGSTVVVDHAHAPVAGALAQLGATLGIIDATTPAPTGRGTSRWFRGRAAAVAS